jgi:hypothetical protein
VGTVIMHNVASVEGRIDDVGQLRDRYFNGDIPITEGGDQKSDHFRARSGFKIDHVRSARCRRAFEVSPQERVTRGDLVAKTVHLVFAAQVAPPSRFRRHFTWGGGAGHRSLPRRG